ncbi:hypothetical protein LZ30DRAFT_743126, partial [Colletotrichum cereale]
SPRFAPRLEDDISVSQPQTKVMIAFAGSMVVANAGTNINVIAFVLHYFSHHSVAVLASKPIMPLAWYCMVTGQALVPWSRLHLVFHDQRKIRMVLFMIVFNAVTMHIPKTVIFYPGDCHRHLPLQGLQGP